MENSPPAPHMVTDPARKVQTQAIWPHFSFVSLNLPRPHSMNRASFSSHGLQINVPEESETDLVRGTGRTPGELPRTERLQGQETFQGRPRTCHQGSLYHDQRIGGPLPTLSAPCRHAESSAWVTQAAPHPPSPRSSHEVR